MDMHEIGCRIRIVKFPVFVLLLPVLLAACGGVDDTSTVASTGGSPAVSPNSVTLAWDSPTSASNLSGYRMYYGTAPGVYQQAYGQGISIGNITTYTVMGLSNGTTYYFAVTAFDTMGNESAYSNEISRNIP